MFVIRRSLSAAAVVLTVALASPDAAVAQEATDSSDADDAQVQPAPNLWDIALDLGLSGALGNTEYVIVTSGVKVEHRQRERFELEWSADVRYGESKEGVIARRFRSSIAFALEPDSHWSPFVRTDYMRDPFRKLAMRTNAGAGLNYTLSSDRNNQTSISITMLHDYESFTEPRGRDEITSKTNARWNVRAKNQRRMASGLRFENTTSFMAVHDVPSDYDLDSTTKLTVPLSQRVGMRLTHRFTRDSTPSNDVKKDDQSLEIGLTIEL